MVLTHGVFMVFTVYLIQRFSTIWRGRFFFHFFLWHFSAQNVCSESKCTWAFSCETLADISASSLHCICFIVELCSRVHFCPCVCLHACQSEWQRKTTELQREGKWICSFLYSRFPISACVWEALPSSVWLSEEGRLSSRLQHSLPKKGINKIWISTLPHKTHLADSSCLQFSASSLKTESATCVKGKKN